METHLPISGWVRVSVGGRVIAEGHNLVTSAGKVLFATIVATSATKPSHFAFGSGSTAASESDTALSTEFAFGSYGRAAITTSRLDNIVKYTTSGWTNNSTVEVTLNEVGILNASSGGTLVARFLTSPFTLINGAVVALEWSLTFG